MQIRQKNALEEVADYYLDTDHLPTLCYEAKKQAGMLFVSVSGAGLYVVIANNYVERMKTLHGGQIAPAIHYILGNCISGLAVLYNSTDIFISTRDSEVIPQKLSLLLKSPFLSDRQRQYRDAVIVFFSALSSLPLAIITVSYHAGWMSPAMVWTQAALTEFDNTLMHFLPIYLALQNPAFRFPVLPFEYAYQYYCKQESWEEREKHRKDQAYQVLKQKLISQLNRAQKRIILDKILFEPRRLTYQIDLSGSLALIFTRATSDDLEQKGSSEMVLRKLTAITQYGNPSALEEKHHPSSSAHAIVYAVGATWVTLSCIGYLLQPMTAISNLTGSRTEGLLLGLPPLYFLMVLMIYFGGNALQGTYDYLTVWGENQVKIPLEFRLYPKASLLSMAIVGYLTLYSYGGASELIYTNFRDTNIMRPILLLIAQTGIPFLSGSAMIDFTRLLINKFALYYGNNAEKMAAQLNAMIDQLKTGISLMSGEKLIASLEALPKGTLSKLGITEKELKDTQEKLRDIDQLESKPETIVQARVINSEKQRPRTNTEKSPLLSRRSNSPPPPSSCCGCLSRFFKRLRGEPRTNEPSLMTHLAKRTP